MSRTLKDTIAREIGTPCLVVDLDIVERNIERLQKLCDSAGVANRPHIKTHKNPVLAAMQIKAGARGITCQKLGEAEIMSAAGIKDIFITYNLLGEEKIGRLGRLSADADIMVAADNATVVSQLPQAARIAGRDLSVMVECDTGRKRTGVETPAQAIALAREIDSRTGLTFAGLMFYPPDDWTKTRAFLADVSAGLRDSGLEARIVSTGGTPNLVRLGELPGTTEHRAGTSIFNDRMMLACGAATLDDCALHIYTTVVSRAAPERAILDGGSKTFAYDTGGLKGFGLLREYPDAVLTGFAEEHGFLDLSACASRPVVGEVVRVIPNHVCVTVNLTDRLATVRGDKLVGQLDVAARGLTR